jgi:hypothetical protein
MCLIILTFTIILAKMLRLNPSWMKNRTRLLNILLALLIIAFMVSTALTTTLIYDHITPINNSIDIFNSAKTEETIPETTEPEPEETIPETTEPEPEETIPETTPPVPINTISPPKTDREMLACVIFQEVGWDRACDECRRRVADVVLNRVADPRYPNTIRGVLTQESQYGKYYWTGVVWPDYANSPYEKDAVDRAYRIADEVLAGTHSELYGRGYVYQASFVQGVDNVYCCGHYFGR